MSIFLSLRSKKGRHFLQKSDEEPPPTEPERVSDNSSSFGVLINQFPTPPTASPTETEKMTLGGPSRQPSIRHHSHENSIVTDEDGLPFIPPNEIGAKFPTPTRGPSVMLSSIPISGRSSYSPQHGYASRDRLSSLPTSERASIDSTIRSHRDRDFFRSTTPATIKIKSKSGDDLERSKIVNYRRSRSMTRLESFASAECSTGVSQISQGEQRPRQATIDSSIVGQSAATASTTAAQKLQNSDTVSDIVASYRGNDEGAMNWSPRTSDHLDRGNQGDHLLYYGKSPSFIREEAALRKSPSPARSNEMFTSLSTPTKRHGVDWQHQQRIPERQMRISSLPLQSSTPDLFLAKRRRNSATTESNAGDSNVALPSSISDTSDGTCQERVLSTHPRYGNAYRSLTAVHDLFSSSSTQLSNFRPAIQQQHPIIPAQATRRAYDRIVKPLQSNSSDGGISQEYSDYADIYADASPGLEPHQYAPRNSSASGRGHKRQATPPLLFGAHAIGDPVLPPSPTPPARSSSRLIRAAEAAGLQHSGRLMRAITVSSDHDWETVAETTREGELHATTFENSSSIANNSTSDSDPKFRGLPLEPEPLPQPVHPRYVQSWTLQKELGRSQEVLIPLTAGDESPVDATLSHKPTSGHTYKHPTPLSAHTHPFNSTPIVADQEENPLQDITKVPSGGNAHQLAGPSSDDHSMSNYSTYDQDTGQGSSAWASTTSPMPPLPRRGGGRKSGEPGIVESEGSLGNNEAKPSGSLNVEAVLPNVKVSKSSSRDTGSSLADLDSSPVPLASSPLDAESSSLPEARARRVRKRRTFDGSLTSIAVEAEERNPMRKYMAKRGDSYRSIEEPDLSALPAASRADIQAQEKLLADRSTSPEGPYYTPPQKRPSSSTPMQKLASSSSSAKEVLDAATVRSNNVLFLTMTPRSSLHGSPSNRARAHGITNSTAVELQPLSPPQAHRIQKGLKRRPTLLRLKRRKSSNSNARPFPQWEDTTRHNPEPSSPNNAPTKSPPNPSRKHRRVFKFTPPSVQTERTQLFDIAQAAHDDPDAIRASPSTNTEMIDLGVHPSRSSDLRGPEATLVDVNHLESDPALMDNSFLETIRPTRRSTIRPKAPPSRPVRPIASFESPHLHQLRYEHEVDLALQKRFSWMLILACLPLFPTLLMLGQPGSDRVVRMLSSGQASGFYKPYTIWTRSVAVSVFSAGMTAIIVVACMGGFE